MQKREVQIVVISDVHLGTYGCHAKELLHYLKSINPGVLILNGDIIDIWQFSKNYWPQSHMKVVRRILKFITDGVPVYYLTGNHDEMLRKFADFNLGSLKLANKMVLPVDGKKAWVFHGDVFDLTMQHSKWLARLGAKGYDALILLNRFINWCLQLIGKEKMSFSKKIKARFKDAVKFINKFERTVAELAAEKGYDYVICGHIHQPEIRVIETNYGPVTYLNSGDWVENLTTLEYHYGQWSIYHHTMHDVSFEDDEYDLNGMLDVKFLLDHMKTGRA